MTGAEVGGNLGENLGEDAPDDRAGRAGEPERRMLAVLVCPVTRGPLRYDPDRQELVSRAAHLAFPIRNGIPILLASEARELD